jgi:hypothetical protein
MGIIVDLSGRVATSRKLRAILRDVQFKAIQSNQLYIKAIDLEIARQEHILLDRHSGYDRVEEALASLDLLSELRRQREEHLTEVQEEFNRYR